VVLLETGPNSLDIHGVGTNRPAYGTSWNVYDRLLTYGSKTLPDGTGSYDYSVLKPELAESWEVAPDGLSVTFRLRADARFHDGTPVTAADVKWSFDRAVSVGGFPTFQMKAGSLEKPEQFEAVGEHAFRVKLLRKDKLTLPDLAVPVPVIINAKIAKEHATEKDPWALEWLKNNSAAGGAYRIESWKPGQEMVFCAQRRLEVRPAPQARPGNRPRSAVALRAAGPAQARRRRRRVRSGAQGHRDHAQGRAEGGVQRRGERHVVRGHERHPAALRQPQGPAGHRLRHPLREDHVVRPLWPGHQALGSAEPCAARRCLATANRLQDRPRQGQGPARRGRDPGGFETTLSFDQGFSVVGEPLAVLLQEALAALDVKVTINKIPGANWRAALLKKDLPLIINNMGGWLNYPEYFFFWAYHGQNAVFNTMSYRNPALDQLVDAARFEKDGRKYADEVRQFITLAYDDVPRVPLFQPLLDVAMQPNVSGYRYWFHRQLDLRQLRKD
jgi:peptide/nickel transport system substrate-binding protein